MIGGQLVANFRGASNPNSPWRCYPPRDKEPFVELEAGPAQACHMVSSAICLILRNLRSKRLEGWTQRLDPPP
jgi:hypothetical protein